MVSIDSAVTDEELSDAASVDAIDSTGLGDAVPAEGDADAAKEDGAVRLAAGLDGKPLCASASDKDG